MKRGGVGVSGNGDDFGRGFVFDKEGVEYVGGGEIDKVVIGCGGVEGREVDVGGGGFEIGEIREDGV